MRISKSTVLELFSFVLGALVMRFVLENFLEEDYGFWVRMADVLIILAFGTFFVLKGTAKIIEETTGVLSERTKIAGGVLQSLGTAFPDMILGVVAAVISLRLAQTDYAMAISYAIIAAATTFGSNIYNIGHAVWCVFRQNKANRLNKKVLMFPGFKQFGTLVPIENHTVKPSLSEFDTSIDVLNVLTVLTAVVAISMVLFGRVDAPVGMTGDLYQLIRPVGIVIMLLCVWCMYYFRKSKKEEERVSEKDELNYYHHKKTPVIFTHLVFSGVAILFAAETMVNAVKVFSDLTGLPFVMTGVLAGIIGCMGEMLVIHNFSVNPKGRLGDAIVGVSMDNIVTTLGAALVAIMGGIFLGGNALILIFVIILTLNTMLIWQISKLKNYFYKKV